MSSYCTTCSNPQPFVSVIVPLYKAERYFPVMLNALQNQTLRNIELIFVDDCGGDRSFEMARNAASTDSRIVCLQNEKNSGPGYSRNKGLEIARGEYVSFVDADDVVDIDFYELLYTKAKKNNALVAKGQLRRFRQDGVYVYSRMHEWQRLHYVAPEDCLLNRFVYEHHTGLYSRDLLMRTGARYKEDTRYGEDTFFLMTLMLHVIGSQFVLEERAIYTYRENIQSITQQKKDVSFLHQVKAGALDKIDILLRQKNSEPVVWYLNYMFNQNLGDVVDQAVKSDIADDAICQYIELFVPRLKAWKESGIRYAPGPQASALINSGYDACRFLQKRKEQQSANVSQQKSDTSLTENSNKLQEECSQLRLMLQKQSRFVSLLVHMPRLRRRYQVLRLRRLFAFGRKKDKCKQKISQLKALFREFDGLKRDLYLKYVADK